MKWLDGEGPIEAGVLATCGLLAALAAGMFLDSLVFLWEPVLVVSLLSALALLGLTLRHLLHRRFGLALLSAVVGLLGFFGVLAVFIFVGARQAFAGPDRFNEGYVVPEGVVMRSPESAFVDAGDHDAGSLWLTNEGDGGRYQFRARVNPREPGVLYVRAHEPVRDLPLSEETLAEATRRPAMWSSDRDASFDYSAEGLIGEGNGGEFYPARIELWFDPEGSGEDRLLLADVFRVEGWMR